MKRLADNTIVLESEYECPHGTSYDRCTCCCVGGGHHQRDCPVPKISDQLIHKHEPNTSCEKAACTAVFDFFRGRELAYRVSIIEGRSLSFAEMLTKSPCGRRVRRHPTLDEIEQGGLMLGAHIK